MILKAISLYEPWASLIRNGRKTIETRSWATAPMGKGRGLLPTCGCFASRAGPGSHFVKAAALWRF